MGSSHSQQPQQPQHASGPHLFCFSTNSGATIQPGAGTGSQICVAGPSVGMGCALEIQKITSNPATYMITFPNPTDGNGNKCY